MKNHPNLYADLSASSGHNAISRDLEFGHQFLIRRADQLLFGNNYLAKNYQATQFELYEQSELPDTVQTKIFRENARKLLF